MEGFLDHLVTATKFCLETLSVFCVIAGLVRTIQLALRTRATVGDRSAQPPSADRPFNLIRIRFGSWLSMALEFQLGADILATTIKPTLEELLKLALISVIRTFLNYFLNKELEAEYELQKQKPERVSDRG